MAPRWNEKWDRVPSSILRGGQGASFLATWRDGTDGHVFIKELRRPRDLEARKRFRREVAAYETLKHPSLPNLIDDNSAEWEDVATPLYLVLECIEGGTLANWISSNGPMFLESAAACALGMSAVLEYCHGEDVIHRDLKPSNVMLRDNDPAAPVVVDFGLSFNAVPDELGEVTRTGEEIANRFLRLPESWGNQNTITDITQLAGLFFYMLTGREPHVLLDHDGNPPHRRAEEGPLLRAQVPEERQFLRITSLFDRAFQNTSVERFQSAADFRAAVEGLFVPVPDTSDLEGLEAHLDEILAQSNRAGVRTETARLKALVEVVTRIMNGLAKSKGLRPLAQSYVYEPGSVDLALMDMAATDPPPYSQYRFELRGSFDMVLKIDNEEVWTGRGPGDSALAPVVRRKLIESYLKPRDA
jgi:serine/threonine protein kinase